VVLISIDYYDHRCVNRCENLRFCFTIRLKIICRLVVSAKDGTKITKICIPTLVRSSIERGDGRWNTYEDIILPQIVHVNCRKEYTRPSTIKAVQHLSALQEPCTSASKLNKYDSRIR